MRVSGTDRQHASGHVQTGCAQQPAGQQRLGQGDRQPLVGAAAQRHHGVGQWQIRTALIPRHTGQWHPGLHQGIPQRLRPDAVFNIAVKGGMGMVRADPIDQRLQLGLHLTHRSPNPLAIMPRKISRVPPRNVKPGDLSMPIPSKAS